MIPRFCFTRLFPCNNKKPRRREDVRPIILASVRLGTIRSGPAASEPGCLKDLAGCDRGETRLSLSEMPCPLSDRLTLAPSRASTHARASGPGELIRRRLSNAIRPRDSAAPLTRRDILQEWPGIVAIAQMTKRCYRNVIC